MAAAAVFPEPAGVGSFSLPRSRASPASIKRSRRKSVSWPSHDKICQVRFFLVDDSPSTLGSAQHILQWNFVGKSIVKKASLCETMDTPPGFHGSLPKRARVNHEAESPLPVERPWCSPQQIVMNSSWLVAEGEESKELSVQQQRELRVLEAFYPRVSCIPDSPAEPPDCFDRSGISHPSAISIIPLEEDGESVEVANYEPKTLDKEGHGDGVSLEPEMRVEVQTFEPRLPVNGRILPPQLDGKAARAACMPVANGLVDQELLVEIFQNSALLKNIMSVKQPLNDLNPMSTNPVCISNVEQTLGSLNKHGVGYSSSCGLPSPVSVLAEWTEASTPKPSPGISLSEKPSKPNVKDVESHSQSLHPSAVHNTYPSPTEGPLKRGLGERGFGWAYENHENRSMCDPHMNIQSTSHRHANRPGVVMCSYSQAPSTSIRYQPASLYVLGGMCSGRSSRPPPLNTALHQQMPQDSRSVQNEVSGLSRASAKTKRLCIYYNTPRGCRKGGKCDFLHQ